MSELKPCPFCGGEPTAIETHPGRGELYCSKCDLVMCGDNAKTPEELTQAWNTRHVETCTIGDYKDTDYGYTHDAMWNDEWFMPSGRCSGCGEYIPVWNYCPNCGRKVEG